ncbi:MAG TPA: BatD family protein, partial [Chitinophagaceae bacterium]|nr:BatD family protein [Chitinophagaceae bacterium]
IVEKIKKNLFVRVEVDKKSCYVNEPIVATYKLYSRLRSESRVVKRPSYNGFSLYDMVEPDADNPTIETYKGRQYNVHIIRKSQLFPLQAGKYTLEPVEVENTVHFIKASSEQDTYLEEIPDPFAETVDQTLTLASEPVDITVKPLPAPAPASYDGAVGNFTVETSLKDPITKTGESSTLLVKIKGKGNIPMITAPSINWPNSFDVYDPTAKEEVHPEVAPLTGEKTFEFTFTPKDTGKVQIPGINFSFFDPASRSYKTDSTRAIALRILPGIKKPAKQKRSDSNDAHTIYPGTNAWWIIGGILATILIWIGLMMAIKRHNRSIGKTTVKPQPVPVIPVIKPDPLDKARRMVSVSNSGHFIKEVESVTWNEVGEKLNIPHVSLNQPQVISALQSRGADEDTIQLFKQLMHDLEYALYIPGQSTDDLQDILNKAERFLTRLNALT